MDSPTDVQMCVSQRTTHTRPLWIHVLYIYNIYIIYIYIRYIYVCVCVCVTWRIRHIALSDEKLITEKYIRCFILWSFIHLNVKLFLLLKGKYSSPWEHCVIGGNTSRTMTQFLSPRMKRVCEYVATIIIIKKNMPATLMSLGSKQNDFIKIAFLATCSTPYFIIEGIRHM